MRNMPPNLPTASRHQLGGNAKGEWEGAPESASQFAIGVWGEREAPRFTITTTGESYEQ
jgi:hypothetical protein